MAEIDSLVARLRTSLNAIDALEAKTKADQFVFIDCREHEEVKTGIIPNSIHLPRGQLDLLVEKRIENRDTKIIVYCASGFRSVLGARVLRELGYSNVFNLNGGIAAWKAVGGSIEAKVNQVAIDKTRYVSQIRIPQVGESGQLKLAKARVLVVGAGGLGSPVALYLAAAGVGTIGIVDPDVVDESNLQRQILHRSDRVEMYKVDSAMMTLRSLNPAVRVNRHCVRLSVENARDIAKDYDIIVDGTDNFETRYLVNRLCHIESKINVHGSVFQWQGHVAVFDSKRGPCYECLFEVPPTDDLAQNCAQGGVLGATTGVVGSLMANAVIKIICEVGEIPAGRLTTLDLLRGEFETLRFNKSSSCPCCSKTPAQTELWSPTMIHCAIAR